MEIDPTFFDINDGEGDSDEDEEMTRRCFICCFSKR